MKKGTFFESLRERFAWLWYSWDGMFDGLGTSGQDKKKQRKVVEWQIELTLYLYGLEARFFRFLKPSQDLRFNSVFQR